MKRHPLFVLAAILAACGGGDSGTNTPPPPPPVTVSTVTVSVSPTSITIGATAQASAVAKSSAGATITGKTASWISLNPAVASVSSSGVVTGVAQGSTTISGTIDGVAGTTSITVTPKPVASVVVQLGSPTLVPGAITAAAATMLDNTGTPLAGRAVTWQSSNPGVGTVAANGQVTAVAPGTTNITATSEGISGSALLTVIQPPVATVAIFGTSRVKVGDAYQYTVEARLADGTLVQRPVTWSLPDPTAGTITQTGLFTPAKSGSLAIRATVETIAFDGGVTAYDWQGFGGGATIGASLAADLQITNKFGASEYPDLVIGCSSGTFVLYVDTDNFVTENGLISYRFDSGTIFTDVWLEFDSFSALAYNATTNGARKTFASLISLSHLFSFAFTEFNSTAKATVFRVTGMTPYLNQMLAACPSNASPPAASPAALMQQMQVLRNPTAMSDLRRARAERGSVESAAPSLAAPTTTQGHGRLKPYP